MTATVRRPFQSHFPCRTEHGTSAPQPPSTPIDQAGTTGAQRTWEFSTIYHASKQKSSKGSRDAILRVSSTGKATLTDIDTREQVGATNITDLSHLRLRRTVFVGRWKVYIEEAHTSVAAASTSESGEQPLHPQLAHLQASRVSEPYQSPRPASAPVVYSDVCTSCKADGREDACDGQGPCSLCVEGDETYCCYAERTGRALLRHPAAPGAEYQDDSLRACQNCRMFGQVCDGAIDSPCASCLDKHRAFCTTVNREGAAKSFLCAAYHVLQSPNGVRFVAPRASFTPDPHETWPPWPPPRPAVDVLHRLNKRFAVEEPLSISSPQEEMAKQFRRLLVAKQQ